MIAARIRAVRARARNHRHRQPDIEQHQVGRGLRHALERLRDAGGAVDEVARRVEALGQRLGDVALVLHHQDACLGFVHAVRSHSSARKPSPGEEQYTA
jgi:hypothetical protein